jgi:acetolactate synthase-1/2/3 large subunit
MDLQRSEDKSIQVQVETTDEDSIQAAIRENSADASKKIISALETSLRPVILVGQGLTKPDAIVRFCQNRGIPFSPSWSAIDKYDDENSLNIGRLGIYGERSTNFAVQAADLVICLGTRLSIPQVGYDRGDFGRNATKIVVDIDPLELAKHRADNYILLNADANEVVVHLLDSTIRSPNFQDWVGRLHLTKEILPKFEYETDEPELRTGYIHSLDFVERLNGILDDDAVVVTDVGAGLISGHYGFRSNGERLLFTSQGLGEMGFGLPGAIGASIADRGRQVVCLSTDGGIMFNLQELQTVQTKKLPLKVVIFNNDGYGMIKISQSNLFGGRFAGSESGSDISFPNFSRLAYAFGFDYLEVEGPENVYSLKALMKTNSASIIEVKMDPNQKYLPRLGTRKLSDGSLQSPGLEDLDPPLSREKMAKAKAVLGIE